MSGATSSPTASENRSGKAALSSSSEFSYVEKRVLSRPGVSALADVMFHGEARRPGAKYPRLEYRFGDDLRHPLVLSRNFHRRGEIFEPNGSWIVSDRVRARLEGLPNIAFLRVELGKAFDGAYSLDQEWPVPYDEDADLAAEFEHDESLAEELGAWFEMVPIYYDQFEDRYPQARTRFEITRELQSTPLELSLTPEMFVDNPVFWESGILLRSDVFEQVEDALDPGFFAWQRLSFDG